MKQLKTPVLLLIFFTVLTGVIYPALITGTGQAFFHNKINGSLLTKNGIIIGSELIGQKFGRPEFFHGRPSAVLYDAAGSGGSNMGPTNKKFIEEVKRRAVQAGKDCNLEGMDLLPSEMVFASGSGLDPHISPESAMMQAVRIASVRGLDLPVIVSLINKLKERQLYFYGNSYVNVLKLNAELDSMEAKK